MSKFFKLSSFLLLSLSVVLVIGLSSCFDDDESSSSSSSGGDYGFSMQVTGICTTYSGFSSQAMADEFKTSVGVGGATEVDECSTTGITGTCVVNVGETSIISTSVYTTDAGTAQTSCTNQGGTWTAAD